MHVLFITKLWNTAEPNLSYQYPLVFLSHNFLRLIIICIHMLLIWITMLRINIRRKELLMLLMLNWIVLLMLNVIVHILLWIVPLLVKVWLSLFMFKSHPSIVLLMELILLVVPHLHVLSMIRLMSLIWILHIFETVIILFYVQLPLGIQLVDFFDDLGAHLLSSSDHAKSITKSIKGSTGISFNYSRK